MIQTPHQEPTKGLFDQIYNPKGHAIISTYNFSPLHYAKKAHENVPIQQLARFLPGPHKWSEIVWAIWAGVAPVDDVAPASLKYLFRHEIATANTRHIMELAGNVGEDELESPWPGVRFVKGSRQYQAIMGTPHGTSVAWLLIDHPDELPGREIESVTMFTTESEERYHLLFTLDG